MEIESLWLLHLRVVDAESVVEVWGTPVDEEFRDFEMWEVWLCGFIVLWAILDFHVLHGLLELLSLFMHFVENILDVVFEVVDEFTLGDVRLFGWVPGGVETDQVGPDSGNVFGGFLDFFDSLFVSCASVVVEDEHDNVVDGLDDLEALLFGSLQELAISDEASVKVVEAPVLQVVADLLVLADLSIFPVGVNPEMSDVLGLRDVQAVDVELLDWLPQLDHLVDIFLEPVTPALLGDWVAVGAVETLDERSVDSVLKVEKEFHVGHLVLWINLALGGSMERSETVLVMMTMMVVMVSSEDIGEVMVVSMAPSVEGASGGSTDEG